MISAAAEVVPNVVEGLFSVIKATASKMRDTAKKVRVNRHQCTRLSERVDTIIEFLQNDLLSLSINLGLKKALERFEAFLQRCLQFIKKFTKSNWLYRIMRNHSYHHEFQQLNLELSQHCQDLNLGLAYHLYRRFAKEDAEDAKHDLEDIVTTVNKCREAIKKNSFCVFIFFRSKLNNHLNYYHHHKQISLRMLEDDL